MFLIPTKLARSDIHGLGVFAVEPIKKGTVLWMLEEGIDLRISPERFDALPEICRNSVFRYTYRCHVSGEYILCADDARFMNHSPDPNTIDLDGHADLNVAACDIAAGAELTCNYYDFDLDAELKLGGAGRPGESTPRS